MNRDDLEQLRSWFNILGREDAFSCAGCNHDVDRDCSRYYDYTLSDICDAIDDIFNKTYTHFMCPGCGRIIEVTTGTYDYCPYCGVLLEDNK